MPDLTAPPLPLPYLTLPGGFELLVGYGKVVGHQVPAGVYPVMSYSFESSEHAVIYHLAVYVPNRPDRPSPTPPPVAPRA